jgi:hypothetical protein
MPTTAVCENYVGAIDTITATFELQRNPLTYSLLGDGNYFKIDTSTGVLSTNLNLDELVGVAGGPIPPAYESDYEVGFDWDYPYPSDVNNIYDVDIEVGDGYETITATVQVYVTDDGQVREFAPSSLSAVGGNGSISVTIGRPEGLLSRHRALDSGDNYGPLYAALGFRYSVEYALIPYASATACLITMTFRGRLRD